MWQGHRIKLSEINRETCIHIVKRALYIAEGAWSTQKQDELVSFAQQIKKDSLEQKRKGNLALYEIGVGIAEYAFLLNQELESDHDLPHKEASKQAAIYIRKEQNIIKNIRASVHAFIREEISEANKISLEEAEVMMALSGEYKLSFSEDL